jgi:choline dehydrogenase-like flavoprotein
MLVDLDQVATPPHRPYRAAVCIAGAGVAGLVLATRLADAGLDVHLLEAGGRTPEARSQSIYDAEMACTRHAGTTEGRFRLFGGSSTRWGGQLLPYPPEVFSPPSSLCAAGWPLTHTALEPYYAEIEQMLGVNELPFGTDLFESLGMKVPLVLDRNSDLTLRFSKWAPFSHRNLAHTLGVRALASRNITVFLHANLTECLLSAQGSTIDGFLACNYRKTQFRFEADQYVMATGTIETSRLLLASRSVSMRGVGNDHHQVGCGIHDHVSAPVAEVTGDSRKTLLSWLGPHIVGATTHTGRLEATTALRERLRLLAVQAHLTIEEPDGSAASVARHLLRSMQRGELRSAIAQTLPRLGSASLGMAQLVWSAKIQKRRTVSAKALVPIRIMSEQRARPENRIRISEFEVDSLGVPKTIVDWRVNPEETRSILRFAGWLKGELARLGIGEIAWHDDLELGKDGLLEIRDTNHLMGGTLMGTDPERSVVDQDLKVHGLENMSIASCSTFPTGGSSNPTFTLMALTLRLAARLKLTLSREPQHMCSSTRA